MGFKLASEADYGSARRVMLSLEGLFTFQVQATAAGAE